MRNEAVAVVLVVTILVGAGAGYLVGNVNERTITTTSTSTEVSTTTSTLSFLTSQTSGTSGSTTTTSCSGLVCGPVPYPAIVGTLVQIDTEGSTICQMAADNTTAVCFVHINGGDSGNVKLNASELSCESGENCDSRIIFQVYSTEPHYVNFTSLPSCAYTSAPISQPGGCVVEGVSPQTFTFGFTVLPGYVAPSAPWFDSIVITMYQTCCWP